MENMLTKLMQRESLRKTFSAIFVLLLAAAGLSVLLGCGNPLSRSEEPVEVPATGTFLLTIGGRDLSRTIAPVWPDDDDLRFYLRFVSRDGHTPVSNEDWTPGILDTPGTPVNLLTGVWDLYLRVFHVHEDDSETEIAYGERQGINIGPGTTTAEPIMLRPLGTGNGTFSWNITVPPGITLAAPGPHLLITRVGETTPVHNQPVGVSGSITTLPPGTYNVVFTLAVDGRENAVMREILRVYSNMTSHFVETLSDLHFPTTLLNIILNAINDPTGTMQYNVYAAGVRARHFGLLNIHGVYNLDNTDFQGFLGWFDTLAEPNAAGPVPQNRGQLVTLVDAALVGLGASGFVDAPHSVGRRQTTQNAIMGRVGNGTPVTLVWSSPTRLEINVGAGVYTFAIDFDYPVFDFTVIYDANWESGAPGPAPLMVYAGQMLTLPSAPGTRGGYRFIGWNTQDNGGGRLHLGGSPFTVTGNVTLYATWSWIPPVAPPALHLVTLDHGTGTGGPLTIGSVPAGTEIILPPLPGAFSNPGSGFSGWSDDGIGTLPAGAPFIVTGPTTLTAQWMAAVPEPVYHTVTLNPNGGIGAPITMRVLSGSTITLPSSGFTWQWHTLEGWAATEVGVNGTPTHGTNVSLVNVTENIILHAVWRRNTYTVTFNINNGSGNAPLARQVASGNTTMLPGTDGFSRYNHIFIGWNTRPEGGAGTRLGFAPFLVTAPITLYAEWVSTVSVLYTVTFEPNGGVGTDIVSSPVPRGTSIILPGGGFTRVNYTFVGWSTQATGGSLLPGNSSFTVDSNITLYAQWEHTGDTPPPFFTVWFYPSGGTENAFSLIPVPSGTSITLPSGGFTREGFWVLIGWARTQTDTVDYAPGHIFPVLADTVLYAVWEAVPATTSQLNITFESITSRVEETLEVSPAFTGSVIQLSMTGAGGVPTSRTFTITGTNLAGGTFNWFVGNTPVTGDTPNSIELSISNRRLTSGGLDILVRPGVRNLNVEVLIGGVPYNLQIPVTVVE